MKQDDPEANAVIDGLGEYSDADKCRFALALLKQARAELKSANAKFSYKKVGSAIKSVEGAIRNAEARPFRKNDDGVYGRRGQAYNRRRTHI